MTNPSQPLCSRAFWGFVSPLWREERIRCR